ncbi:unnamed protein product [Ilex paraguariensis]|uniref:Uncharacterized protein n=1 Tax=Ilex paraguariensis TaxID=185542 RepID=A0ABC8RVL5_9AQUA
MSSKGGETVDIHGAKLVGLDVVKNCVGEATQVPRAKEMATKELGADDEASPRLGAVEEGTRLMGAARKVGVAGLGYVEACTDGRLGVMRMDEANNRGCSVTDLGMLGKQLMEEGRAVLGVQPAKAPIALTGMP